MNHISLRRKDTLLFYGMTAYAFTAVKLAFKNVKDLLIYTLLSHIDNFLHKYNDRKTTRSKNRSVSHDLQQVFLGWENGERRKKADFPLGIELKSAEFRLGD